METCDCKAGTTGTPATYQLTGYREYREHRCGATYRVGDPIWVIVDITRIDPSIFGQRQARFRLLDQLPDGRAQVVFDQVLTERRYLGHYRIIPPLGTETLVLQALLPGGEWAPVAACSFQVSG